MVLSSGSQPLGFWSLWFAWVGSVARETSTPPTKQKTMKTKRRNPKLKQPGQWLENLTESSTLLRNGIMNHLIYAKFIDVGNDACYMYEVWYISLFSLIKFLVDMKIVVKCMLHANDEYMYLFFKHIFFLCIVNGVVISCKKSVSCSESNFSRAIVERFKQIHTMTVLFLRKPFDNSGRPFPFSKNSAISVQLIFSTNVYSLY